jgi:Cap4, dsDNA endonuclease domain
MLRNDSPDETLDEEYSGADTTRRYLYQAAYGALQSVRMVDDKSEIQEVYCEKIEDILLKITDGSFIGIQVKTQKDSSGGFKFGDEAILKAIARFVTHEDRFPGKFKRYQICVNCGFIASKDASDLKYCIKLIVEKKGDLQECYKETNFSKYIKKLKTLSEIDEEELIVKVLCKVELKTWSSLRDYRDVLISEIGHLLKAEYQPHTAIKQASLVLTDLAFHAGEFRDNQSLPAYHTWINDPEKALLDAIIKEKKIDKKKVSEVIENCFRMPGLLRSITTMAVTELPRGMDILSEKLDEGKIRASDIAIMKDCDNSALALVFDWYNAYDANEATARYDHLKLIMQRECSYAFNATFSEQDPFGQKMLGLVRDRINDRYHEVNRRYEDCGCEHLEGIAAILSELCTVWWSKQFTLRGKAANGPI